MFARRLLVAVALAVTALGLTAVPAEAAPTLLITKVYVNTPGKDRPATNTKVNAEYTNIKNYGSTPRNLTGWTLRDKAGHVYTFPEFVLAPGKIVTVKNGTGKDTSRYLHWGNGYYIWNNTGDTATLRGKTGTLVDTCTWGKRGKEYEKPQYQLCV